MGYSYKGDPLFVTECNTLVELIAAIAILASLITLTSVTIVNIVNNARNDLDSIFNIQIKFLS